MRRDRTSDPFAPIVRDDPVRITLQHRTSYRFDAPVFLEPHVIRLRPGRTRGCTCIHLDAEIDLQATLA